MTSPVGLPQAVASPVALPAYCPEVFALSPRHQRFAADSLSFAQLYRRHHVVDGHRGCADCEFASDRSSPHPIARFVLALASARHSSLSDHRLSVAVACFVAWLALFLLAFCVAYYGSHFVIVIHFVAAIAVANVVHDYLGYSFHDPSAASSRHRW